MRHECKDGDPCRCDGSLTFAEAMALDPRDVEVEREERFGGGWFPLNDTLTLGRLRASAFRRSRPLRSRVQEMAVELCVAPPDIAAVIRAVCEYLRAVHGRDETASAVEREFLVER